MVWRQAYSHELSNPDDPCWRRFGPGQRKPCADPNISLCALWACQKADQCQKAALARAEKDRP